MRKIFTISVLSVLAVMGTASAAPDLYATSGRSANLNVATVNYVKDAVGEAKELIVKSDKKTNLGGSEYWFEQTGSDNTAPTIKYMEDSIAAAVEGIDTSGLVEKAQVVTSAEGQAVSVAGEEVPVSVYSSAVQSGDIDVQESMDSEVASVNTVAEHFVPNVAKYYDYEVGNLGSDNLKPGDYVLTVSVDDAGNKVYVWRAMNVASDVTTVNGYVGPT